jgi:hypothetical protein
MMVQPVLIPAMPPGDIAAPSDWAMASVVDDAGDFDIVKSPSGVDDVDELSNEAMIPEELMLIPDRSGMELYEEDVVPVCADVELNDNVSDFVCLAVVVEILFGIVTVVIPKPGRREVGDSVTTSEEGGCSVTTFGEVDWLIVIVIAIASPEVKAVGDSVTTPEEPEWLMLIIVV